MVNAIVYAVPVFVLVLILEVVSYRFLPDDTERGTAEARAEVVALAEAYAGIGADVEELAAANIGLWRAIVLGSRNVAYLLSFNSLVAHALAVAPVPPEQRTAELLDVPGHQGLARLIDAGRGADAAAQARRLLDRSVKAVTVAEERT